MSVNKVILVGNVGKDPEVRYLEGGTAVCSFPLATSETYRNRDGERVSNTEWHNIVLWRGLAEIAEKYIKKGSQLYIEGRIRSRSWEDRDGNKRYTTEVIGDNMQMLGRKQDDQQQQNSSSDTVRDSGSAGGPDSGSASGPDSGSAGGPDSGSAGGPDSGSAGGPDSGSAGGPDSGSQPEGGAGTDTKFNDIDSNAVSDDLPF